MRCLSLNKGRRDHGFTLVEVMIIAPIVILVISSFVALLVSMIGDALVTREQNNMSFEIQDSLDRIEQDTRLTSQFLTTSLTMPSPQGSDSNFTGTAAFSSTNTLILGALTTDKNPTDSTRQLVYYAKQPNDCGSLEAYNRVFQAKIMYFIKDGSLWRRVVVPNFNLNASANDETLCSTPWQRNTCSPGYAPATRCQTRDTEVMKNIDTFNVKYLSDPASSTDLGATQALSAQAIEVTISGKKQTKGREITSSGTIRATRLNNIDVDLPLPTTPNVTGKANSTSATFSWASVPNATSYLVSYNINGGGWTDIILGRTATSYTVNANRNDTVSIRVTAKNSTGTSPSYGSAAVTIPLWYPCALQAGWQAYGADYETPGYTKTTDDVVVLKGMMKDGTVTAGTTVCILPEGYRPNKILLFQSSSAGSPTVRIDIFPTGEVKIDTGANAGWISLDGINFVASTAPYSWTSLATQNLWVNYDAAGTTYSTLQGAIDGNGRVHIQGMVKNGTYTNPTAVTTLPVAMRSPEYAYFPARSSPAAFNFSGIQNTIDAKGINGSGFYSLQAMYYPTSFTSWSNLPLANGWTQYATTHSLPRYTKGADGLVTVKGLVKNGATGVGTVMATLPPGYRPAKKLLIHTVSNGAAGGAYGRVDVDSNGNILAVNVNAASTSFDGIQFMADQ